MSCWWEWPKMNVTGIFNTEGKWVWIRHWYRSYCQACQVKILFSFLSNIFQSSLLSHIYYSYEPTSREHLSFRELVEQTCTQLEGAFALVFKSSLYPGQTVATRRGSPLLVGFVCLYHRFDWNFKMNIIFYRLVFWPKIGLLQIMFQSTTVRMIEEEILEHLHCSGGEWIIHLHQVKNLY